MGFKEVNDYVGRATQRLEKAVFGDYLSRNIMNERQMVAGGLVALMPCTIGCKNLGDYAQNQKFIKEIKPTGIELQTKDLSYNGKVIFTPNPKDTSMKDTSFVSTGVDSTGKPFLEEMSPDSNKVIDYHVHTGPGGKWNLDSITIETPENTTGTTYTPNNKIGNDVIAVGSQRAEQILIQVGNYKMGAAGRIFK